MGTVGSKDEGINDSPSESSSSTSSEDDEIGIDLGNNEHIINEEKGQIRRERKRKPAVIMVT